MERLKSAKIAFLMVLMIFSSGAILSEEVCFSGKQLKSLERLKIRAQMYKRQLKAARKYIARIEAIAKKATKERDLVLNKPIRPCKVCACVLPWIVVGATAAGCGVGLLAIGLKQ